MRLPGEFIEVPSLRSESSRTWRRVVAGETVGTLTVTIVITDEPPMGVAAEEVVRFRATGDIPKQLVADLALEVGGIIEAHGGRAGDMKVTPLDFPVN